jgi:hypothetical protein
LDRTRRSGACRHREHRRPRGQFGGARLAPLLALLALPACGLKLPADTVRPDEIETTVLLIGDAGEPDPRNPLPPPLDSLAAHAAAAPDRTVIVFLGDNVYPDGIPEEGAAEWADARRRLAVQVRAVPPGARGIFLSGNHDWASGDAFGLYAVRLQERLIRELADGRAVELLPSNGCPGPVSIDRGRLRLVVLDTQWWLHSYIVEDEDSNCPTNVRTVTAALREAVRPTREDQVVVVAAHHPLLTGGKHGAYCGITGPFKRFAGSSQDILSGRNRQMRDSLTSAFAGQPPLVYAAGHDHNLQVLRGGSDAGYVLISGAGAQSRVACAVRMRESHFVSQHRVGFMRLDIMRGGGVLLSVYDFDREGRGGMAYARWLETR